MSICPAPRLLRLEKQTGTRRPLPGASKPHAGGAARRHAVKCWEPGERVAVDAERRPKGSGKGAPGGAERAESSGPADGALPDVWLSLDLWSSKFLS